MRTIPREVSGIPTHETFTLLLLVVIHGLRHPHREPLDVIWFRWSILNWIRVWWQQVWFYCSRAHPTSVEYFLKPLWGSWVEDPTFVV